MITRLMLKFVSVGVLEHICTAFRESWSVNYSKHYTVELEMVVVTR